MAFLKEYENLGELGRVGGGSFAQVYKVRHNELGYVRAIRKLKQSITDKNSKEYKDFLTECKFLLRLGNNGHPNIVRIYRPRLIDNQAFWEMDYVEGSTVEGFIESNSNFVPTEEVKRCLLDISNALAYCHVDNYWFSLSRDEDRDLISIDPSDGNKLIISSKNRQKLIAKYCVVHNDIKSNNVMRKFDGSYILLDFGLAFSTNKRLSRTSLMNNGGIEYKAPEKWDKKEELMTERTDIYSFGIMLYEMLAGRLPFIYLEKDKEESFETEEGQLWRKHTTVQPPAIEPLRRAAYEAATGKTYQKDYPGWLEKVIMKCLEKDPKKRYTNGKELHEEVKLLIEKENKNIQLETQKPFIIERIVEKPVEVVKIVEKKVVVEKPVERIIEKRVIKKVTNPFWLVVSILFFSISVALAFAYYRTNETSALPSVDTEQISQMQQQLDDKQVEIDKLESQNKQLQANNNNLESQKILSEQDREIANIEKRLDNSNAAELQRQITQLKADLASAKSNSGNATDLQRQINNKNNEINNLNSQIKQKDAEIKRLQQALKIALQ